MLQKAMDFSLAVYRVCKKMPESEPMAAQLKKTSNELVGDLVMENLKDAKKRIDCLSAYFEISASQEWMNPLNWKILGKESHALKEKIISFEESKKSKITKRGFGVMSHNGEPKEKRPREISPRQKEIISFIQTRKAAKISDLAPLFKDEISRRTLRMDLKDLLSRNLIGREGLNKNTVYFSKIL